MENEDHYAASFCPSFSSYTGDGLVETAERVRFEFSDEHSNDDFEFVNLRSDYEAASFSGDFDFVFPLFNQTLIPSSPVVKSDGDKDESSRGVPVTTRLRDLFLRDLEDPSPTQVYSSSSSDEEEEENESNGISTQKKSPNGGWRKSKSTGSSSASSSTSSRRWRIKDLLKRSYSEGKQSLGFQNPSSTNRDESSKKKEKEKVSAHEKLYLKNRAMKEEEKRRSYLPYKQNLVGLFFNFHHRFGKTIPSS
ncbi:unnamed protein product [Thlaspi arvense]|uniref:Uncharacterized protein n=1 Tax=Thlaspi arvense TaxID=13288 RepID=A0AAU9TB44_THLAR|nr:unnamed protein product [Thlaspi arvense]